MGNATTTAQQRTDLIALHSKFYGTTETPEKVQQLKEKIGDPEQVAALRLMHSIIQQTTPQSWEDFVRTGELPIVKLTPAQMEQVRGGILPVLLAILYTECTVTMFLVWSNGQ